MNKKDFTEQHGQFGPLKPQNNKKPLMAEEYFITRYGGKPPEQFLLEDAHFSAIEITLFAESFHKAKMEELKGEIERLPIYYQGGAMNGTARIDKQEILKLIENEH